ncbi:ABC transporter permease family protein [Arthrobacter dokdonensis]|uniref:hypothetical protein n=1 Tax=Arthrobacter dokdonellae TaxID=2211210 RepID=UPI001013D256|nr:hypothetical protein [Arthrobacter dokdonellae]
MAWRDIRRHKGRSALIVALIALPIFGLSFAATAGMSMVATPAETVAMELGQTQGRLSALHAQNSHAVQTVEGDLSGSWGGDGDADPNFVPAAPIDAVPAGFTTIPWQTVNLSSPVGKAHVALDVVVTDALNPAFKGKYTLLEGRAPSAAGEALGTPGLLKRFGLHLGEKLTTSAGTFELVGTLRVERQGDGQSTVFLQPGQVPAAVMANASEAIPYLVGERPLAWADAKGLNAKGVMLTSRDLILHPPGKVELGADAQFQYDNGRQGMIAGYALVGALIGVLALLEVGLLAGAAFAVGARKQQRDLALLAASGAEGSMLRTTVTAGGLWMGLAGGASGAVLGTVAAVATVLVMRTKGLAIFPGLHLMWLPAVGLVLLGVAAGLVAAMVPARAVAKQATLAALKSGRTADVPSKWTPRIGAGLLLLSALAMVAAGIVAFLVRGSVKSHELFPLIGGLIIAGAVLLVAGLIFLTGRIIAVLTTHTGWLPVPLRLAARDAARNRGRTVPAVASVLAAATLAGALIVGVASMTQKMNDEHLWQYNQNQTSLQLEYLKPTDGPVPGTASATPMAPVPVKVDAGLLAKAVVEEMGPETRTLVLKGVQRSDGCYEDMAAGDKGATCIDWDLAEPPANRCALAADYLPANLDDWRCKGSMSQPNYGYGLPPIVVGGEAELNALLGRAPSPEARAMLHDGGMVLTNEIYLSEDGTATIISHDAHDQPSYTMGPGSTGHQYLRTVYKPLTAQTLPAMVDAPEKNIGFYGVVSPETASRLKLPVSEKYMLVSPPKLLSQAENDKVNAALAPFYGGYSHFYQERGLDTPIGLILWLIVGGGALVTLSAAGITAGLALADGRNDHATLASIGADTRLRKAFAGSQTLMTALLGAVLGLFAGAVPTVVVLSLQRGFPVVLPWLQMGALVILVPLFGAAAAWVLTRGKLPMTRRQTLA